MSSLLKASSIAERLDDLVNPIVVKELRQAVQGRLVAGMLMLFLVVAVSVLGFVLLSGGGELHEDFDSGRSIFLVFFGVLLGTCLLFVPAQAAMRINSERTVGNVDLLFVSTLSPWRIIRGKFLAAAVLTAVMYSVCMPFMTLTYLLRGIDLPTIFILLVMLGIQVAIFIACIPFSKILKSLFGLGGLGAMFLIFTGALSLSFGFIEGGVGATLGSWEGFWAPALTVLVSVGAFGGLLFVLSSAMISPVSSNRAFMIRLYMALLWLIGFVVSVIWSWSLHYFEPMMVWNFVIISMFCIMLIAAVSERDRLGPRLLRAVPRSRLLRLLAFPFFSGAAGGLFFASMMIVLTIFATLLFVHLQSSFSRLKSLYELIECIGGISLYFFCYALTGSLFGRFLSARTKFQPSNYWVVTILLMAAGSILPPVVAFLIRSSVHGRLDPMWHCFNPFVFLPEIWYRAVESAHPFYFSFGGVWAAIVLILNLPWLYRQIADFRPYSADDSNSPPSSLEGSADG